MRGYINQTLCVLTEVIDISAVKVGTPKLKRPWLLCVLFYSALLMSFMWVVNGENAFCKSFGCNTMAETLVILRL